MTGVIKVKDKKTGETKIAVYAANRLGNMQYNVDGRFYSDKVFNQRFEISAPTQINQQ